METKFVERIVLALIGDLEGVLGPVEIPAAALGTETGHELPPLAVDREAHGPVALDMAPDLIAVALEWALGTLDDPGLRGRPLELGGLLGNLLFVVDEGGLTRTHLHPPLRFPRL